MSAMQIALAPALDPANETLRRQLAVAMSALFALDDKGVKAKSLSIEGPTVSIEIADPGGRALGEVSSARSGTYAEYGEHQRLRVTTFALAFAGAELFWIRRRPL